MSRTFNHFLSVGRNAGFTDRDIEEIAGGSVLEKDTPLTETQIKTLGDIVALNVLLREITGESWLDRVGGGMNHPDVKGRTARQIIRQDGLQRYVALTEFCAGGPLPRV